MRGKQTNIMEIKEKKFIKCGTCGEVKELCEKNFYKDKYSRLGFRGKCKKCTQGYYKKNRIKRLSYQNEYNEKKFGTIHKSDDSYNVLTEEEKMKIKAYELLYPRKI